MAGCLPVLTSKFVIPSRVPLSLTPVRTLPLGGPRTAALADPASPKQASRRAMQAVLRIERAGIRMTIGTGPGADGSSPAGFVRKTFRIAGGLVTRTFFAATRAPDGREVWRLSAGVPTLERDVVPGPASSDPRSFTVMNTLQIGFLGLTPRRWPDPRRPGGLGLPRARGGGRGGRGCVGLGAGQGLLA